MIGCFSLVSFQHCGVLEDLDKVRKSVSPTLVIPSPGAWRCPGGQGQVPGCPGARCLVPIQCPVPKDRGRKTEDTTEDEDWGLRTEE